MFDLHLYRLGEKRLVETALGDGVDVAHDPPGGLMNEREAILGEQRRGASNLSNPMFDVREALLFGKCVQMSIDGNGVDQRLED